MVPKRTDRPKKNKKYALIAIALLFVVSVFTAIPDIMHDKQIKREQERMGAAVAERREKEKVISPNDQQIVEWYNSTHPELVNIVNRLSDVDKSVQSGDQGAFYEHQRLTAKLLQLTDEPSQFEYDPDNSDFEFFIKIYKSALENYKHVGMSGSEMYTANNPDLTSYVQRSWEQGNDKLERSEKLWDEVFVPKIEEAEESE